VAQFFIDKGISETAKEDMQKKIERMLINEVKAS